MALTAHSWSLSTPRSLATESVEIDVVDPFPGHVEHCKEVVECTMDGIDPALKATWMTIEEIRQDLRNKGM